MAEGSNTTGPSGSGGFEDNNDPEERRPSIVTHIRTLGVTREEAAELQGFIKRLLDERGDGRVPCPRCRIEDVVLRRFQNAWKGVDEEVLRPALRSCVEAVSQCVDLPSYVGNYQKPIRKVGPTNGNTSRKPTTHLTSALGEGRGSPLPAPRDPRNVVSGFVYTQEAKGSDPDLHTGASGSSLRTVLGTSPLRGLSAESNVYEGEGYPDPHGLPIPPTAPLFNGIGRRPDQAVSSSTSTQPARQPRQGDGKVDLSAISFGCKPNSASNPESRNPETPGHRQANGVEIPAPQVYNNQRLSPHPPPLTNGYSQANQQQPQPRQPHVEEDGVTSSTSGPNGNTPSIPQKGQSAAAPINNSDNPPTSGRLHLPSVDFFHRLEAFRQQIHQETHEFEVTISAQNPANNRHNAPASQTLLLTVKPKAHPSSSQPNRPPPPGIASKAPRPNPGSSKSPVASHPGIQLTSGPTSFQFHVPPAPPLQPLTSQYPSTDSFKERYARAHGLRGLAKGIEANVGPLIVQERLDLRGGGLNAVPCSSSSSSLTSERAKERRRVEREKEMVKKGKTKESSRGGSKQKTVTGYFAGFGNCSWKL
ncbi:hypothetical protein B0T14DRAFT_134596 [Immersiella caudata]|uniref:Uncharacterized protein n=1 Tax=Immersiella caudata TaxID=314043 RepID=A0AA40C6Z3_9PEZI|nr:hypothetical protein B0T14DRAFT_134596 [Immersiella caudata]